MTKYDKSKGAVSGFIAFAAGYAITFLLKSGASRLYVSTVPQTIPSEPSVWQVVGWVYYLMHNVEMTATFAGGPQSRTLQIDPTGGQNIVWEQWLLVLPPLLLLLAGYRVAQNYGVPTAGVGAKVGTYVTLGYLPPIVLGAVITNWSIQVTQVGMTVNYGPDLVQAILIAGIVYPIIAGGIGGYLYGSRTADSPREATDT